MKARSKRSDRLSKLVFVAPIIIIIGLVVYGYALAVAPGTLIVEAIAQDRYVPASSTQTMLQAPFEVGQTTWTTPKSLSESSGTYQVIYGALPWYTAPASREITVPNGHTVYAIGVYTVIARVISVSDADGFNTTAVTAEHNLTPVIWINPSQTFATVTITGMGSQVIEPGQNLTNIFQNPGEYSYELSGSTATDVQGVVDVQ